MTERPVLTTFHQLTAMSEDVNRIPTVDDLRIKLCYICREEEYFDAPESPPRPWTHPCKCTLIAHESCLLKWIQTSQSDARRAPNALKCPQCGAQYEVVSRKGKVLQIISLVNRVMQRAGRLFTVGTALGCAFIFGSGVYIVLTGYGAYAVQQFIGKEMYDTLLTDDPVNWPWTAYINLPSLTLSLILSRLHAHSPSHIPLFIPLLLVWPHSSPVGARRRLMDEYWQRPENARDLAASWPPSSSGTTLTRSTRPSLWFFSSWQRMPLSTPSARVMLDRWPPSPIVFGLFIVPIVRTVYRKCFTRLQAWALGTVPPSAAQGTRPAGGWEWRLGDPFVIRVRMEDQGDVQGAQVPAPEQGQLQLLQQPGNEQNGEEPGEVNDVRANVHVEVEVEVERPPEQDAQQQQPAPEQGQQQELAPEQEQRPNEAAVAAAEQLIEVDTSSLGRRIAGALLIPAISNRMGALLLRLSKHSYWLRKFLAVRPRGGVAAAVGGGIGEGIRRILPPALGPWSYSTNWEGLDLFKQMGLGLRLAIGATWNGTRTWAEADPVWWRNAVGFGLFVFAKDCLQLLHLWLAKRELESRHVKNRDFSGVDIKELDLVPSFFAHA